MMAKDQDSNGVSKGDVSKGFSSDMLTMDMKWVPFSPKKMKINHPSQVVSQVDGLNFKLPEDLLDHISKLDELRFAKFAIEELNWPFGSSLSVSERLEGWSFIKRRRHGCKQFDKYYYHQKSGYRRFRSRIEVNNFILFGIYPRSQYKKQIKSKEDASDEHVNLQNNVEQKNDEKHEESDELDENPNVSMGRE